MDKVLHIPPAIKPNEAALVRADISHFVLHSVVSSQIDEIVFHAAKREVEHALINSKLLFTILRPNGYMQNVAWTRELVSDEGRFVMPYWADAPTAWVDRRDHAEALARVLTEPGYLFGTYESLGTEEPLIRHEMAVILAETLGRPVAAEAMDVEAYSEIRGWETRPATEVERLSTMFTYFDVIGGYTGNSKALEIILGRKPRSYRGFAADFVAGNA